MTEQQSATSRQRQHAPRWACARLLSDGFYIVCPCGWVSVPAPTITAMQPGCQVQLMGAYR